MESNKHKVDSKSNKDTRDKKENKDVKSITRVNEYKEDNKMNKDIKTSSIPTSNKSMDEFEDNNWSCAHLPAIRRFLKQIEDELQFDWEDDDTDNEFINDVMDATGYSKSDLLSRPTEVVLPRSSEVVLPRPTEDRSVKPTLGETDIRVSPLCGPLKNSDTGVLPICDEKLLAMDKKFIKINPDGKWKSRAVNALECFFSCCVDGSEILNSMVYDEGSSESWECLFNETAGDLTGSESFDGGDGISDHSDVDSDGDDDDNKNSIDKDIKDTNTNNTNENTGDDKTKKNNDGNIEGVKNSDKHEDEDDKKNEDDKKINWSTELAMIRNLVSFLPDKKSITKPNEESLKSIIVNRISNFTGINIKDILNPEMTKADLEFKDQNPKGDWNDEHVEILDSLIESITSSGYASQLGGNKEELLYKIITKITGEPH